MVRSNPVNTNINSVASTGSALCAVSLYAKAGLFLDYPMCILSIAMLLIIASLYSTKVQTNVMITTGAIISKL